MAPRFQGTPVEDSGSSPTFGGTPVEMSGGERAVQYASGFNEGLAQALGMPVDLVNAALAKVGFDVDPEPFLGSAMIERGLQKAGTIEPEREDAKFGRRVAKEVGMAAPFAAVPAGAAL